MNSRKPVGGGNFCQRDFDPQPLVKHQIYQSLWIMPSQPIFTLSSKWLGMLHPLKSFPAPPGAQQGGVVHRSSTHENQEITTTFHMPRLAQRCICLWGGYQEEVLPMSRSKRHFIV